MIKEIPEVVIAAIKELRTLKTEFDIINYRMGTNGERGLFPRRKSLMARIIKAELDFIKKFSEFELVKRRDYNFYYVNKVQTKLLKD
jgi:hypothetical protein